MPHRMEGRPAEAMLVRHDSSSMDDGTRDDKAAFGISIEANGGPPVHSDTSLVRYVQLVRCPETLRLFAPRVGRASARSRDRPAPIPYWLPVEGFGTAH